MRYASVRAPVLGWSCLLLVACSGRSSLNDFANGSTDTVKGRPNGGTGSVNDDAGSDKNDAGGDDDDDGGGNGGDDNNGGDNNNSGGNNNGGEGGGIGDACADPEDCAGRSATCLEELNIFSVVRIPFPGGYCTQSECEMDSDCPTGSRCFTSIPQQAFCAKTCRANSDCRTRESYTCTTPPLAQDTQTYCLPPINIPGGSGGFPGGGSSGGGTRGGNTRGG